MDTPIVNPTGKQGKVKLALVPNPVAVLERIRATGIAAGELQDEADQFANKVEIAREFYQDPTLRQFLDMPDDVFERELLRLREAAESLECEYSGSVRAWYRKHPEGSFVAGNGGAA